ncbi:UDP-N-acetylglucosamine 1-carboxyvinyltransferase [Alphaproteobacteria bacterium]
MGAKNLATKAMVASLLSDKKTTLHNVPHIGDLEITECLIKSLGVEVKWIDHASIEINPGTLRESAASLPDSRTNRIPILLLSILLHKVGKAIVPVVGGDNIGKRNVDFHIAAIEKFGATVRKEVSQYVAYADNRLRGAHVELPYPSVGATETCLFLSILAKGTSVIKNIATEPEIIELITMLRSMGAVIFLDANRELVVHGVEKLSGTNFEIIGDRIEAASWAALACASNGRLVVGGIRADLLGNFLSYYTLVGGGYKLLGEHTIEFYRERELLPVTIETDVYPGFSTDWQQPFCTLLTQANGISVIHETVHEQRFGYLEVLNKLNAKAQTVKGCLGSLPCRYRGCDYEHSALIHGPTLLQAIDEPIVIPDLRAGLAYLIAATLAKGTTVLLGAEQIERGYGNLIHKLAKTSVNLERAVLQ